MESEFNFFVGRKVAVTETKETIHLASLGDREFTTCEIAPEETLIKEISEVAGTDYIRVWLPGVLGTCDVRPNRLNVHIDKMTDGSYELTHINWG